MPTSAEREYGFRSAAIAMNCWAGALALLIEWPALVGAAFAYADGDTRSAWWLVYCYGVMLLPPLLVAAMGIVPSLVLLKRRADRAAFLAALIPFAFVACVSFLVGKVPYSSIFGLSYTVLAHMILR